MKTKPFLSGLGLGIVFGVLITGGFYRTIQKPVYLTISGTVRTDSATYRESRPGLYLADPIYLQGPVYLESENIDINDLYKLTGHSVSVSGQMDTISVMSDESIPKIDQTVLKLQVKKYGISN